MHRHAALGEAGDTATAAPLGEHCSGGFSGSSVTVAKDLALTGPILNTTLA